MSVSFAEIFPLDTHPALTWLGKHEGWLTLTARNLVDELGRHKTYFTYDRELIRNAPPEHREALDICFSLSRQGDKPDSSALRLLWFDAVSHCLANGPKLFRPTDEQFESMTHVELHFPVADYRQCYLSLVIEIPAAARRALAAKHGYQGKELAGVPSWVVIRHRPEEDAVFIGCRIGHVDQGIFFTDHERDSTIEQGLTFRVMDPGDDPRDFAITEDIGRAALNLSMMLTHYGTRTMGPVDPVAYQKHRRRPGLAKFAPGDFVGVELTQQIVVRRVEQASRRPQADGGGWEQPPGWRRGHWRRRPLTPQDAPKTVFVNPCFVRADLLPDGDRSVTRAEYQAR